ncbi:protein of unknown function [Pseudodesulfovibrio profundus]|uniref:Uncharacterized protein n=1 Tax=Pseudodesulfovibrio profundus TaxID=57320 RepID=A0A2C8F305_9BACT|nr:hypothetical protein [Pseudodesulfovibrio profundus]SOB56982.1 protein of unknown function [Pseudodesulfovibrio profundus]
MREKNWTELANEICKEASLAAHKPNLESNSDNLYFGEDGKLWKGNDFNEGHHQLHVNVAYYVQAANRVLSEEEEIRYRIRQNQALEQNRFDENNSLTQYLGIAASYLSDIGKSWNDVERIYKEMHSTSQSYDSGHNRMILGDLADYANALKMAADTLKTYKTKMPSKNSATRNITYYDFCPFCWRIVFYEPCKIHNKEKRCSVHKDSQSKETKRDRNLRDFTPAGDQDTAYDKFKTAFWIELKRIRKETIIFRRTLASIPSEYENYVLYQTDSFDPTRIPIQSIDLSKLWSQFPNTAAYAKFHLANLNDMLSVLKTLDDPLDPTGLREKIHIAYSRAPILAIDFLMNVELWRNLDIQSKQKKNG